MFDCNFKMIVKYPRVFVTNYRHLPGSFSSRCHFKLYFTKSPKFVLLLEFHLKLNFGKMCTTVCFEEKMRRNTRFFFRRPKKLPGSLTQFYNYRFETGPNYTVLFFFAIFFRLSAHSLEELRTL